MEQLIQQYKKTLSNICADRLISVRELAKEIGMGHQTLLHMIDGKRIPNVLTLRKIRKYLSDVDGSEKKV
jgi:predicted transcriptional regulator